jgi:hypothetical protein
VNTSTAVVTTGVITAAGRWANDEPLDIKFAIGIGAFAVIMSVFSAFNDDLAGLFGLLVMLLASFKYLPGILSKLGLSR